MAPDDLQRCHGPAPGVRDAETACFRRVPLFAVLPDEDLALLSSVAERRRLDRGEAAFTAGRDPARLFVVAHGLLKVTRVSASGREQVVRLLGPGDFYGEVSLFRPRPLEASGIALEPAVVCMLGRSGVERLLRSSPEAGTRMLAALAERIAELEALVEQLAVHPVESRVAALLLKLANAAGQSRDGGLVRLPLPQEEVARVLGTTQETLSRRLRALHADGVIRLEGRGIVRLLRTQELRRRAESLA